MKTTEQRINNIIGQLEGIKKMLVKSPDDCFALLTQMKAVKSAVSSLTEKILSVEFNRCLGGRLSLEKRVKMEGLFKEIIKK
jgi:DNA-binding FrmR family transcriptional regulator